MNVSSSQADVAAALSASVKQSLRSVAGGHIPSRSGSRIMRRSNKKQKKSAARYREHVQRVHFSHQGDRSLAEQTMNFVKNRVRFLGLPLQRNGARGQTLKKGRSVGTPTAE